MLQNELVFMRADSVNLCGYPSDCQIREQQELQELYSCTP